MRRADRLFQIVQLLRAGKLLTAQKLAERLEVSPRTIYRDIAELIGAGVPIEGEAGLGYLMRSGYDLPPLMFSADEVVALVAGMQMVRAWGDAGLATRAQEALEKIEAVLPGSVAARAAQVNIHAFRPPGSEGMAAGLEALEAACNTRTRLALQYADATGAQTARNVRPLGVIFWGRAWTLVAWCELRGDFRVFRLDRIAAFDPLDTFPPNPDISLAAFYAQREKEPANCDVLV
ncbi:MAG TPA: YafY family transcriptional regulator [Aliiroseovarius sp.]|nr:YafY family transcriptional regulator [Aliiroseovarius sp.]